MNNMNQDPNVKRMERARLSEEDPKPVVDPSYDETEENWEDEEDDEEEEEEEEEEGEVCSACGEPLNDDDKCENSDCPLCEEDEE